LALQLQLKSSAKQLAKNGCKASTAADDVLGSYIISQQAFSIFLQHFTLTIGLALEHFAFT
jgi:hypothetical protein